MSEKSTFETWGLVEVMGHTKYAGYIREESIGGASFVRVDVPEITRDGETRPAFTKFLGSSAIFGITPTTEEIARGLAESFRSAPISVYDLPESMRQPKPLPLPVSNPWPDAEPGYDEDDEDDDEEVG